MEIFNNVLAWSIDRLVEFQQLTGFPQWVNDHAAVWPVAEILHFIGLCLLIGAVGMFDLRLLGMAKRVPAEALERLIPWGVLGFVLCLGTGLLFVVGNAFAPGEYLKNISFLWKMLFILFAGVNLWLFHVTGTAKRVRALNPEEGTPFSAKIIGATSLILWVGVIVFGRLLPTLGDAF